MFSTCDDSSLAFIAVDGDRVGESMESFLARVDLAGARAFSEGIAHYFVNLRERFEQIGATVYFSGGDSLLTSLPREGFDLDLLRDLPIGPCTVSIGVGSNSCTAMMALKVAKALGRNQIFSLLDNGSGG